MINISYYYQNGKFILHVSDIYFCFFYFLDCLSQESFSSIIQGNEIIMTMLQHLIIPESQLQTL